LSTHKTFPLTSMCAEFISQICLFSHIKRKNVDGWLLYYFVFKGTDIFIETNKLLLPESSRKFEPVNNAYKHTYIRVTNTKSCILEYTRSRSNKHKNRNREKPTALALTTVTTSTSSNLTCCLECAQFTKNSETITRVFSI